MLVPWRVYIFIKFVSMTELAAGHEMDANGAT